MFACLVVEDSFEIMDSSVVIGFRILTGSVRLHLEKPRESMVSCVDSSTAVTIYISVACCKDVILHRPVAEVCPDAGSAASSTICC